MTNANTDTLRRDDMHASPTEAFDALAPTMQKALKRAAVRRTLLPADLGQGWIMVPARRGAKQVAYEGRTAWPL